MNLSKLAVTVIVATLAGFLLSRLFSDGSGTERNTGQATTKRFSLIKSTIEEVLSEQDGACVQGESHEVTARGLAYSVFTADGYNWNYLPRNCERCSDVVEAGLATKKVMELSHQPNAFEIHYTLTPLGRELYQEKFTTSKDGAKRWLHWQFCLGKVRLYRIDEVSREKSFAGTTFVRVKFTPYVDGPHPFLFDPKSKPLRLVMPLSQDPALLESQITSIVFHADGSAEYRPDLQ